MSNASAIGVRGCAIAARAACDAHLSQLELKEDVPRHGLSSCGLPSRPKPGACRPVERAGRAAAGLLALVRPGEEDLHATDVGGMSNASAIGVRGCAIAARAACDAHLIQLELEEDVPRHGLSSWPPVATHKPGAWQIVVSVAFGRTKTYSLARPAH